MTEEIRILHIDDDKDFLQITKLFLDKINQKFNIKSMENPKDALEFLQMNPHDIDIVLCDYQMPSLNGLQILEYIRLDEKLKSVPYIMFTGRGREEVAISALNLGADYYYKKGGDSKSMYEELGYIIGKIIEHSQIENTLKEREQQLRKIIDLVPHAIYAKNIDGKYILANEAVARHHGTTISDILGKTQQELLGGKLEDYTRFLQDDREVILSGKTKVIAEEDYTYSDGMKKILKTTKIPYPSENNSAVLGISIDVTEEKRLQEALNRAKTYYQSLFDNASDAIFLEDEEETIIDVNQKACLLFGYSKEELTSGMKTSELQPPEATRQLEIYSSPNGDEEPAIETIAMRKDGFTFPIELTIAPIKIGSQTVFLSIVRDISERKRMEETIKAANQRMNIINSLTRHDLLNQLNTLIGYSEFIKRDQDKKLTPNCEKALERIEDIANKVKYRIDLTQKITSPFQELGIKEPKWQDIIVVIQDAAKELNLGSIRLETNLEAVEILCDPLLDRIFKNMIENTINHAGNATTRITISSRRVDGNLKIIYEDDGIGIPDEEKELIFKAGYGKNHGYGLFLVKEILVITGLNIIECGEYQKGARFEISVPQGKYRIS